jgi:hypothetical protein
VAKTVAAADGRVIMSSCTRAPCYYLPSLWLWILLGIALHAITDKDHIPDEVRYKSGYVNPAPRPPEFTSAMPWGIAIADTRVSGYQNAQIEVAQTQFSCRVSGKDVLLNDDRGSVRGGLYRRHPWFSTDVHDPIPLAYSAANAVILRVGVRPTASGISGPRPPGRRFRQDVWKAARFEPLSKFHLALFFK